MRPAPAPLPPDGAGGVLVIPTLNEAQVIGAVLSRLRAALPAALLLVVDDASPDGTAEVVERAQHELSGVHLLRRAGPRGLREAIVAGMAWACARADTRWVGQLDADGSHPAACLPLLLSALQHSDLAVGCRYMPGGGIAGWTAHRRALSRAGTAYARVWLGLPVRDATSGLRLWRVEALARVQPQTLRCRGYAFQVELGHRAHRAGLRTAEVPFVFVEREAGHSKMSLAIAVEAAVRVPAMRLRPWRPGSAAGGLG